MKRMRVTRLHPAADSAAGAAELAGCAEVAIAASAADWPGAPVPSTESVIARLTAPEPPRVRLRYWVGRDGDRIAGIGLLVVVDNDENSDLAVLEVTVHPGFRRRGLGNALLRELAAAAVAAGRTTAVLQEIAVGSAGQAWADTHGFAVVQSTARQTLDLSGDGRSAWPESCPAGYRLARWAGTVPDEFLASYAAAKDAMRDAPMGDSTVTVPTWTPERIREAEADFRARGTELLIVAAVSERPAVVVGLTEIEFRQARPDIAFQRDTVVLPGHRGHGLGLAMKAENLRWLTARYPTVRLVRTSTATDNEHMIGVNQRLGFTVERATQMCEAPLASLANV